MLTTREMEYELAGLSEYEEELEYEDELELETGIEYSVIGPTDDRFQIRAQRRRPSTRLFPMSTICFLERATPDRCQCRASGFCPAGTGTLISPRVVLTAKHVLMRLRPVRNPCRIVRRLGRFRRAIRVTPGADLSAPAGSQMPATPPRIVANATRFRVHPTLDFGVIILPRAFRLPDRPNRFMLLQPRSDPRTATLLTIAGYPCDKLCGTMWGHSNRIQLTGVETNHLRYTIDTCPGHSGSPIWLLGNDGIRILLGIHTNGPSRCDNDPHGTRCLHTGAPVTPVRGENCGVRITCQVIDQILSWCREFGLSGTDLPRVDRGVYDRRCRAN